MHSALGTQQRWISVLSRWISNRSAFANLSGLVVAQGGRQVAAFVTMLLVARGMGQSQYGVFAFAVTIQNQLFLLGTLGIRPIIVREGSRSPDDRDSLLGSYLVVTTTSSLLAGIVTIGAAMLWAPSWEERLVLIMLGAANVASCVNIVPFFDLQHRSSWSGAIHTIAEFGSLLIVAAMAATGKIGLIPIGFVLAAKLVVVTIVHVWVYHRRIQPCVPRWDAKQMRRIMAAGWPLLGTSLVASLPISGSVVLVRVFRGVNETAFMGVACVLAQSYLMYATLGYRVLLPEIFGAEVKTLRANSSLLTYATGYLLACGGLALATAWVAICIFLPVGYRAAFWPTNLLLVAAMIGGLSMIARAYLLAFQDELSILLGYGAGALLFLAVGIPATREFAFWGTAMTAVLSMSVGLAVMAWRLWRHWSPADVPTSHGMIE